MRAVPFLLCVTLLGSLGGGASGQDTRQFKALAKTFHLSGGGAGAYGLAAGDFDRDGDVDCFAGSRGATNSLFRNDGSASFAHEFLQSMKAGIIHAAVTADVDGDRDLDLVVGYHPSGPGTGQTRLYLGDGKGFFFDVTRAQMPADNDFTNALALGDLDGDGDLDLVLGNQGQTRLYLNDGKGKFSDSTATGMPKDSDVTQALALGDVDGDRDLDLVIGNGRRAPGRMGQQNKLYLNDGKGKFSDGTAGRLAPLRDVTNAVLLADLNGDGTLELVEGNGDEYFGIQNRIHVGYGTGLFRRSPGWIPADLDFTTALGAADVDGDGDLDLVLANYKQQTKLYRNDWIWGFTDVTSQWLPSDTHDSVALAVSDLDGDKDPDLLLGNYGTEIKLYLNVEGRRFADATEAIELPGWRDLRQGYVVTGTGDFDGDGDVDVVMGSNRMYRNEGHGKFKDVSRASLPWQSVWVVSLAVGDVDGDRDLDLVLGARGTQNRLYLNDGKGKFSESTTLLPKDSDLTFSVSLGDMDRDGDLDLVLGNRGTQNKLYLNDGKGRFSDVSFVTMPPDTDPTAEIHLADVDGDGDLDMVLANGANNPVLQSGQNKLYINQGLRFRDLTATNMPKAVDPTLGVAVADFDGDRDLDLFFGNGGPPRGIGRQNRLYLNDGKGRFSDATSTLLPRDTDHTRSIAVGDIDADGDVDIVSGQYALLLLSGRAVTVLLNNGKGKFQDSTVARLGYAPLLHGPTRITLADLDRDGDPDLLLQAWPLWNLHRQVWGDSLARLGHDYVLDFHAEPGYASTKIAAVPWLSLAKLQPGIPAPPFGLFRLNPALMVSVPPVVTSWAGKATLRLPLPNLAALKGRTLFTQALFLHAKSPTGWRLSNVSADTVIR